MITIKHQPGEGSVEFFGRHPIFSTDEYHGFFKSGAKRTSRAALLHYFVKTKRLLPIRRGLYAVIPSGSQAGRFGPNRYLVAAHFRPDTILCYHTALEVMGHAHNTSHTLYGFTSGTPCNAAWREYRFRMLQFPQGLENAVDRNKGIVTREVEGSELKLTGPERTLVDCLNCPAYAGGVEEATISLRGIPLFDLDAVAQYLELLGISRVFAAVGAFLEQDAKRLFVPDRLLAELEKKRPKSRTFLEQSQRGGILLKRWNLIVPRVFLREEAPLEV